MPLLLLMVSVFPLLAQDNQNDPNMVSAQFDMTGFPQWSKDLRRGEIVAFGSFPFAYFFANFGVDVYRSASNNWDSRYAPWPFTGAGAIDKTQDDKFFTIGAAVGGAVLIALVDYGIARYKRNRLERETRNLPDGTPIIIRKPLSAENSSGEESETGRPDNAAGSAPGNP